MDKTLGSPANERSVPAYARALDGAATGGGYINQAWGDIGSVEVRPLRGEHSRAVSKIRQFLV